MLARENQPSHEILQNRKIRKIREPEAALPLPSPLSFQGIPRWYVACDLNA